MISNLFLIMLLAHIVGDFYLQSNRIAKSKNGSFKYLLVHLLIYGLTSIVFFVPVFKTNITWYLVGFIISHIIIDLLKFFVPKKYKNRPWVYVTDQLLHVLSIIVIAILFENSGVNLKFFSIITNAFSDMSIDLHEFLKVSALILLVLKPINISFKKIFNPANVKSKHEEEDDEVVLEVNKEMTQEQKENEVSLGATIGSMERLLIVILLLLNEYTAIGLVLTGKSVARYNKLSAEYYIVGTFFSLLSALIPYLVIMHFM